jgi:thiol:disulfide interchange protein
MKRSVIAAVVVALAVWGGAAWAAAPPPAAKAVPRAPAITWHSYEEGLELAKKEKKAVVIDAYAEWCHWCKKMDTDVYTDRRVIALDDRVVFVKVDVDKRSDVKTKYRVQGLPTIVVLKEGKEVRRILGYEPASQFAAHVQQAVR